MRLVSSYAVFVGEYSELLELRVTALLSYLLDILCLSLFMYLIGDRVTVHFADFINIGLSTIIGIESVVFLCMCIATTFSLHEFEFKAKWEELKRKRRVMKAKKARRAKEAREARAVVAGATGEALAAAAAAQPAGPAK